MKRNFYAIVAFLLIIGFSSFSVQAKENDIVAKGLDFLGKRKVQVERLESKEKAREVWNHKDAVSTIFFVKEGQIYANMWSPFLKQAEAYKQHKKVQAIIAAMLRHELTHVKRHKYYAKHNIKPTELQLVKDEIKGYKVEKAYLMQAQASRQLKLQTAIDDTQKAIDDYKKEQTRLIALQESKKSSQAKKADD